MYGSIDMKHVLLGTYTTPPYPVMETSYMKGPLTTLSILSNSELSSLRGRDSGVQTRTLVCKYRKSAVAVTAYLSF